MPIDYTKEKLDLNKGLHVLTGINGSGKTRLLELLYEENKEKNIIFFNANKSYSLYVRHDHSKDNFKKSNLSDLYNEDLLATKIPNSTKTLKDLFDIMSDIILAKLSESTEKVFNSCKDYFLWYLLIDLENNDDTDFNEINKELIDGEFTDKYNIADSWNDRILKKIFSEISKQKDWDFIYWDYLLEIKINSELTMFDLIFNTVDTINLYKYFFLNENKKAVNMLQINPHWHFNFNKKTINNTLKHNKQKIEALFNKAKLYSEKHSFFRILNDAILRHNNPLDAETLEEHFYRIMMVGDFGALRRADKEMSSLTNRGKLSDGEKLFVEMLILSYYIENDNYKFLCNNKLINKPQVLLLDEPDAFLNPQLAKTMITIIKKEFVEKGITVIMTTHSPSTVAYCKKSELFWIENGEGIKCKNEQDKQDILTELTPGLVLLEDNADLIYRLVQKINEKSIIILCEGSDDERYLEKAKTSLNHKYDFLEEAIFIGCGGSKLPNFAQFVSSIIESKKGKVEKIVCVVDNDNAGRAYEKKLLDNNRKCARINIDAGNEDELDFQIEYLFWQELTDNTGILKSEYNKFFFPRNPAHKMIIQNPTSKLHKFYNKYQLINKDDPSVKNLADSKRAVLELKDELCNIICNKENIDFSGFMSTLDKIRDIIK